VTIGVCVVTIGVCVVTIGVCVVTIGVCVVTIGVCVVTRIARLSSARQTIGVTTQRHSTHRPCQVGVSTASAWFALGSLGVLTRVVIASEASEGVIRS